MAVLLMLAAGYSIRWSADGKDLFVANYDVIPAKVYQIEVSTGRRQLVYNLAPSDAAGLWGNIDPILLTPDGKSLRLFRLQDSLGFVCRQWTEIGAVTARALASGGAPAVGAFPYLRAAPAQPFEMAGHLVRQRLIRAEQ